MITTEGFRSMLLQIEKIYIFELQQMIFHRIDLDQNFLQNEFSQIYL